MATSHFTQLRVWQKAHALTLNVYQATKLFPADERFVLVPQMRRAAISIETDIAEGYGRRGAGDKARFYTIGLSSGQELTCETIISRDLHCLPNAASLLGQADDVCRMLRGLEESVLADVRGAPPQ